MLKVNNKSCEQKQVTFITAAQRAAHWWKCGTNGKCEWICEEQGEFHLWVISSPSRISCVKGKGIDA